MSGTFQLAFNGETTPLINAAATAEELRAALESLDSITTTAVSRDYAVSAVGGETAGGDLDLTFGSQSATCSNGEIIVSFVNEGATVPSSRLNF